MAASEVRFEVKTINRDGWISAEVENRDGVLLGSETAPVVEGATFDVRAAVIRAAVEEALHSRELEPRE